MTKTTVKVMSFDLELAKNISMCDFFDYLMFSDDKEIRVSGYTNYLFVRLHEGYIVGLLICFKGDKKILATKDDGDIKKVNKIKLKKNQRSTQASLFCIDPTSMKGMFYSYHGGVSSNLLQQMFTKIHRECKNNKVKDKAKEFAAGKEVLQKHTDKARKYYEGNFKFNINVTPNDIKSLINQYGEIAAIEMSVSPALDDSSMFRPCLQLAKSHTTKINLNGASDHVSRVDAIMNMWNNIGNKEEIIALKLLGKSITGGALEKRLGDNLQHFNSLFLDDFIEMLPDVEWGDFVQSKAMDFLIKTVENHPAIIPKVKSYDTWKKTKNKTDISTYELA